MQRPMRRSDRQLDESQALSILAEADHGFLGTVDAQGEPYVVPVHHIYDDGCIIVHCAGQGHKIDNIRANPRVCFTVCTQHEIVAPKYITRYRSAIAFGTAEMVSDPGIKRALLQKMVDKLCPGNAFLCGDDQVGKTGLIRIRVERLTGKAGTL